MSFYRACTLVQMRGLGIACRPSVFCRAFLRHVRGVRPNRAAKFRGASISDLTKIFFVNTCRPNYIVRHVFS